MRIKKSDKYTTEREDIINRALEILQLDEDKSFILYEIDKDIVYLDDTNILSSDGKYSINGGSNQNFNIMVGGYYQIGSVELGLQTYFLRDIRTGLTVGFVF
jgi:hypothetical protein